FRQGLDAAIKARYEFVRACRPAQRLAGNRLNRRQRVLDAVIEFVEQQLAQLVVPFALGDIARHFRGADNIAGLVAYRRDGEGNVDAATVLGETHRFEMVHALATTDFADDGFLFILQIRRDETHNRPADNLLGLVAENARGTGVPGNNPAIQVLADDRVVRRGNDGGQACGLDLGLPMLRNIDQ